MIILVEFLALILFLAVLYSTLRLSIVQARCKHDQGIRENQACDAICKSCGKNLGFIGTEENKIRRTQ